MPVANLAAGSSPTELRQMDFDQATGPVNPSHSRIPGHGTLPGTRRSFVRRRIGVAIKCRGITVQPVGRRILLLLPHTFAVSANKVRP
jgi:hypothetical protein